MPAFLVATVQIKNPEVFAEYGKAIAGLSDRFGGEYIVRGSVSEVIEGDGQVGERVVITRFPDIAALKAFINSPEYQKGRLIRESAAEAVMRIIEA